jgi:hypothetical protein
VPLIPSAPVQPPDEVQPVASVELHVNIEALPLTTLVGFALKVAVAAGGGVSVLLDPPPHALTRRAHASTHSDKSRRRAVVLRGMEIKEAPIMLNMKKWRV